MIWQNQLMQISTIWCKKLIAVILRHSCLHIFRQMKGCVMFFRPETIVASFLHLMVLAYKPLINHFSKFQICASYRATFNTPQNIFVILVHSRTIDFVKIFPLVSLKNYILAKDHQTKDFFLRLLVEELLQNLKNVRETR